MSKYLVGLLGSASALAMASFGAHAGALPSHGHFVSGQGAIAKANQSLTVKQSSTTGIIDWNSFSIGRKDGVTFDNGTGATLNHVTGGNLSRIAGALHATGSLYLINAEGAIVSGTGRIVTGGNFAVSSGQGDVLGDDMLKNAKAKVVNRGSIVSSGTVTLAGREVGESGTIHAAQVNLEAGRNLVVGGAIVARKAGGSGGTIIVESRHIRIVKSARISASGTSGGTILIGGDVHGGAIAKDDFVSQTVATARTTAVAGGAKITADASAGRGGDIVVWSDGHTTFQGAASARGTIAGGFTEVSSHDLLAFEGAVDLTAANGATGTLLLDPYNVTISSAATHNGSISGGTFKPNGKTSVLNVATLEAALGTANVTVTTGSSGKQAGNITIASAVKWSSGKTLKLDAFHSIAVDATVTNTGSGNLVLRADATGTGAGTATFGSKGEIDFAKSKGLVSILYNPSDNPAGSQINATSYTSPTSYSSHIKTNNSVSNQAIAYMLVNTVYDLQNIQNNATGDYALGRNIDASATDKWNPSTSDGTTIYGGFLPIDYTSATEFSGTLNGMGHTISHLYESWNGSAAFGLIGYVGSGGIVRDLTLSNVAFNFGDTEDVTGVIAGDNSGAISDVHASGKLTTGIDGAAGGLVGESESSATITGSSSSVSVSYDGSLSSGGTDFGGLVGQNFGVVTKSDATGDVTDEAANAYVGGLVGLNNGTENEGLIENSFATGTVTGGTSTLGGGSDVGGLVGYNVGSPATKETVSNTLLAITQSSSQIVPGTILQSYATGEVIDAGQYEYIGGLVGDNDQNGVLAADFATGKVKGGSDALVGGLVGSNNAIIAGTYATGAVTGGVGDEIGGLVGLNAGAGIAGSWALGNVTAGAADDSENPREAAAGGLVGRNQSQILESFAMGDVKVGASTSVSEGATATAGGLVGEDYGGSLDQVYSVGTVTGGKHATVGGLSGGAGEDYVDAYWDTQTSGLKKSKEGTGLTTAQLQAALPSGFDNTVWSILPKQSFPYLDLQTFNFVTGKSTGTPQVISGTVSGGSSDTDIGVGVLVNGKIVTPLSYMRSGANGYYYILVQGGTLGKKADVLVYTTSGSKANRFQTGTAGSLLGFNLDADTLIVSSPATSESALLAQMKKALGSNNSDVLFTTSGAFTSGIDLDLDVSGSAFSIDDAIDVGTGAVDLDASGSVSETGAGKIVAKTLNGKSGGAVKLTGSANEITDLGAFSTAGNAFALDDDQALTVEGKLNAGAGNIGLTTTGSGHNIAIDAIVETSGTIALVSAGNVTESTSTGAIKAVLLNVTADTGITLTSSLNAITKLGTDKTKAGPNKVTL